MEVSGKVVKVTPVQTVGTNNFKKCEVWITTEDQYPQTLSIEFTKELADEAQSIEIGADLKISINLRGRTWTNPEGVERCFNSIQAYKYESSF